MSSPTKKRVKPKTLPSLSSSPAAAKSVPQSRQASPAVPSPSPASKLARTFEAPEALDTPTGGRIVRREIGSAALSRKPSPVKKKEVLNLWDK